MTSWRDEKWRKIADEAAQIQWMVFLIRAKNIKAEAIDMMDAVGEEDLPGVVSCMNEMLGEMLPLLRRLRLQSTMNRIETVRSDLEKFQVELTGDEDTPPTKIGSSNDLGRTSSGKKIPSSKEDYMAAGLRVEGPISANGVDDFNPLPSPKWKEWTAKDHEEASKAHESAAKKIKSTHQRMNDDPVEMQVSFHKGFALMHKHEARDMK